MQFSLDLGSRLVPVGELDLASCYLKGLCLHLSSRGAGAERPVRGRLGRRRRRRRRPPGLRERCSRLSLARAESEK